MIRMGKGETGSLLRMLNCGRLNTTKIGKNWETNI